MLRSTDPTCFRRDAQERLRSCVLFILFGVLAMVVTCVVTKVYDQDVKPIVKGEHDERLYDSFVLANGLEVVTVSDPSATKSAAAIDCAAGSNHDPQNHEGLAHLLEHMLFLGSRKQPKENGFMRFLSANGGSANAFTSSDHTNVYMEVNPARLEPAMHMLADALHSPLLAHSAIGREILAIDAEYSKNMHSDRWQLMQLLRRMANPRHPFSHVGAGNSETLLDSSDKDSAVLRLRMALQLFHAQHYIGPNLKLSIVGPQSPALLRRLATDLFASIPSSGPAHVPPLAVAPFVSLGRRIDYVPITDSHLLQIAWPVPPLKAAYKTKPQAYFSHILGHEGNNSLAAYLVHSGLAEGLTAGMGVETSSFSTVRIVVRLTDMGVHKIDSVLGLIFEYISSVRAHGPQKWVHDEICRLSKLRFDFGGKAQSADLASALANNLHYFPPVDILRAPNVVWEWDAQSVDALLARLTPDNALVMVGSPSFTNQPGFIKDKELGATYRIHSIGRVKDSMLGQQILHNFHLPPRNPYLLHPHVREVLPQSSIGATPRVVAHGGSTKLWYIGTSSAKWPKAAIFVQLFNPLVLAAGPRQTVLSSVVRLLWEDALRTQLYAAKMAGIDVSLDSSTSGFILKAAGFAQHLPSVIDTALSSMFRNFSPKPQQIRQNLAILRGVYRNVYHSQPLWYAQYIQKQLLRKHVWAHDELERCATNVTTQDVISWIAELRAQFVSAEALVYGELSETRAVQMVHQIEKMIPLSPSKDSSVPSQQLGLLSSPALLSVSNPNAADDNSAVIKYIDLGNETPGRRVLLQILSNLASESFFAQIRSREQLGYSVACHAIVQHGRLGLLAQVQSRAYNTTFIAARIDAWLSSFVREVSVLSQEDFQARLAAVLHQLQPVEESDSVRADRMWREIREREYKFDRRAEQLQAASHLQPADLLLLLQGAARDEQAKLTGAELLGSSLKAELEVRVQADRKGSGPSVAKTGAEIQRLRHLHARWPVRPHSVSRLHRPPSPEKLPLMKGTSSSDVPGSGVQLKRPLGIFTAQQLR
jgi:insulysin